MKAIGQERVIRERRFPKSFLTSGSGPRSEDDNASELGRQQVDNVLAPVVLQDAAPQKGNLRSADRFRDNFQLAAGVDYTSARMRDTTERFVGVEDACAHALCLALSRRVG